jgi:hypothetical protein
VKEYWEIAPPRENPGWMIDGILYPFEHMGYLRSTLGLKYLVLECTFACSITPNILPERAARLKKNISSKGELHA